jgi:hypothetical protein
MISIPEEIIFVPNNGLAEIRASVRSSSPTSLLWYHQGRLINATVENTDPRFFFNVQGMSTYVLTITRFEADLLGKYEAVVSARGMRRSDSVELALACEKQLHMYGTIQTEVKINMHHTGCMTWSHISLAWGTSL